MIAAPCASSSTGRKARRCSTWTATRGSSKTSSKREIKQYGDIQRYNIRVPGGGGGGGVGEVNRAQSFIVLNDWGDRERTADEIATSLRRKVAELPGVRSSVVTPTAFNWGGADPFKAVLGGPDYETLSRLEPQDHGRHGAAAGLPERRYGLQRAQAADQGVHRPGARSGARHLAQ